MASQHDRALSWLQAHPDTFFTVSELARFLKVPLPEKRKLRLHLKTLVKQGTLIATHRGKRFAYPTEKREQTDQIEQKTDDIAEVLAEHMDSIIEEFQLPKKFPEAVLAEAAEISDSIDKEEIQRRTDLRSQITVTIDGETAKDFDDAIAVEDIGQNRIRLRVSIADVSYYVAPGSRIDKEAYGRGTSVYFPERVLPMLPEKLSNDICSLVPHKDRLTFTAEIDFDRTGKILHTDFYRSIIRNHHRLTYTEVASALVDKDEATRHKLRHILPHLELMHTLFKRLRKCRLDRGSLDFDLPEPVIIMNLEEGTIDSIVKSKRTEAHMMIEEFMIAANEAVATFITEQESAMIYRIHEEPSRDNIKELQATLHNIGYALKIPKKRLEPKALAQIIAKAADRPESRMINTLLLRSLAKAIYSIENRGHFGLASTCYTHFTSPIRRYPDLMVHRTLGALLEQKKDGKTNLRRLDQMAEQCSLRERIAMQAEWAVRSLMQAAFMTDRIGTCCPGVVSGVTRFGLYVELVPFFVEGLLHIRKLDDDYYHFIEETHTLIGKRRKKHYRIGDTLDVRIASVDLEKRWIDLEMAPPPDDS